MSSATASGSIATAKLKSASRWNLRRRSAVPTVLQLEAAECGAASLAMVLAFHGRQVPLETLRGMCGVSRDGTKASSLLRAARAYGLQAKGLKAEPQHLRDLPMPAIAFVDFCHFLVVEKIKGERVYLNDPAGGRRQVGLDEFDAMFTGVVLTFVPGPDFARSDERPSLAQALLARTDGVRMAVGFVILASLALVLPGLVLPVLSRVFVDYVLVRDLQDWLTPLLIGMLATAACRLVLRNLQNWALMRAETRLAVDGARELFRYILRLPVSFFGSRYAGEIANRLDLSDGLAGLLTGQVTQAVLSFITASFFLLLMMAYDVWIALIVLAMSLLNLIGVFVTARVVTDGHRKQSIEAGKLAGVELAGLRDIETFKAAGAEDSFFARWSGLHANVLTVSQDIARRLVVLGAVPALLSSLTSAIVLILGGLRIMQGEMTIGMLVAFQSLAASFIGPVMALTGLGSRLQEIRSFTERVDDILRQPAYASEAQTLKPVVRLPRGDISIRDLDFGYLPLDPPLLSKFNLEIPAGSSIALVGSSGSGKSTLGRLITGLYAPGAGAIYVDGVAIGDWPRAALAGTMAYIDQDIVLFEGTMRDNLTLWDDTIPEAQMIEAAHDAMIHDVIAGRPGTYDSLVEEAGRNFSGGQRQRLEIARALSTNPRVLVMDEATSALDTLTEAGIMENIRTRGATLVIIAHRLSTIRDCDQIIVLENGVAVEQGTHDELILRGARYAELIEA